MSVDSSKQICLMKIERISDDEEHPGAYPTSQQNSLTSQHTSVTSSPQAMQDKDVQVPSPAGTQPIQERKCSWLFVGNLATGITNDEEFVAIFTKYGKVCKHFINFDKKYAFIRMDTHANAETAFKELNLKEMDGEVLHVRNLNRGNVIKVADLSPVVSNELLKEALSKFGHVERAVVIADCKGKSTTRGIVEFLSEEDAQNAVQQIQEGCFLMTSSALPISATLMEQEDPDDGLTEEKITKTSRYYLEREVSPRLAQVGSFEEECAKDWKLQQKYESEKREELERNLQKCREIFQAKMEIRIREYQTMLLKQDLIRRQQECGDLEQVEMESMRRPQYHQQPRDQQPPPFVVNVSQRDQQPPAFIVNGSTSSTSTILIEDDNEGDSEMTDMTSSVTVPDMTSSVAIPDMTSAVAEASRAPSTMDLTAAAKAAEKPHKCLQCNKRYKYKTGLYAHRNIHNKDKAGYTCDVCLKTFANAQNCRKHRETVHAAQNEPPETALAEQSVAVASGVGIFKCLQCPGVVFHDRLGLRRHMTVVHKKKKCFMCDKTFHQIANLISHESTHKMGTALTCHYCGKRFKHRGNFKAHVRVHTGEKPFKCDGCGKGYGRNDTLQNHLTKCTLYIGLKRIGG